MKAVDKNISRHENGTLYYVARVKGRLVVKSLKTREIKQARARLGQIVAEAFESLKSEVSMAAREPLVPLLVPTISNPPPLPVPVVTSLVPLITLSDALVLFEASQICLTKGRKSMLKGGSTIVLQSCKDLASFNPASIWSAYRDSGKGSSCNHLRWWLRLFVPFGIKRGWLPYTLRDDLEQIPLIRVNSRKIRIPSVEVVDEFLQMVESEDKEAGDFLRFLASSGLRLSGANHLTWEDVDFTEELLRVLQKGGKISMTPLTSEAMAILLRRRAAGIDCPFGFSDRRLKKSLAS